MLRVAERFWMRFDHGYERMVRRTRRLQADPSVREVLVELRSAILDICPAAEFEEGIGDDPEGVYLTVRVDVENFWDILDPISDLMCDIQLDRGLPVYLAPERPIARDLAQLAANPVEHRDRATLDVLLGPG